MFSNQDAWEKARAHHVAIQKLACFDEPCAALAKRVDFSASYNHDSIIFGNAHALLNTLLFLARSTAPDFSINHTFIAGVLHVLLCVGTPTEPAISGHGADVTSWLKCPTGKSVLYSESKQHAETPSEKTEEGDRKSKNDDSSDTSGSSDSCEPEGKE